MTFTADDSSTMLPAAAWGIPLRGILRREAGIFSFSAEKNFKMSQSEAQLEFLKQRA